MARIEPQSSTRRKERLPSFFKVLIGDFSSQLRIPPKFAKHLESNLNQTFRVRNSAGDCWYVRIERNQNILCLTEGWREFVQDNALELGDFLIFSCSGISDFDVTVYGKDCCEKNAVAADEKKTKSPSSEGNQNEVDQPVRKDKKCGTNVKPIGVDSDSDIEHEISTSSLQDQQQSLCRKESQEKSRAFEAIEFVSKHPSFQVRMQKSYLQHGFLNLPKRYLMEFTKGAKQNVTLRISKKTWSVKLTPSGHHLRLREGWRAFAKSNSLKIGDICIFEVLEGTALELQACGSKRIKRNNPAKGRLFRAGSMDIIKQGKKKITTGRD
ncbi:unnamed protein product [Dovyalis caffra]|uniref:TF-B3 domain-containing protein n=1 Tax=Dovyalis caffra TaxID=77055 RepID=A0AAV1RD15_9ROSI|nr:unnamed protein product [Dovyalis caffra]